jgi:poly(A) polymerase
VAEGKPVAPAFLLAAVLWQDVRQGWQAHLAQGAHPAPALQTAIDDVFDARIGDVSGRGKLAADMREIWMMQPRFERRNGNTPFSLAEQPRFRAGFDFLRLRADVGEVPEELADWWQTFSLASQTAREGLVEELRAQQRKKPPQPKPQRPPKAGAAEGEGAAVQQSPDPAARPDAPPRKRRRRRRKPAGGAAGADNGAAPNAAPNSGR